MPRPPRDPDDLDDVLEQVSDALDELEVVDGDDREALLGSLREVLGALGGVPMQGFDVPAPPPVRIVEGGLADDAPASTGRRPTLRLAQGEVGDAELGQALPDDVVSRLRVVRIGRVNDEVGEPLGQILLAPGADGAAGQVLVVGARSRCYRVRCVSGRLTLHVNRTAVATLAAGQTVDVEARRIRVSTTEPSEGRYLRLPG